MCRCTGLVLKLLSSQEDEISPHNPSCVPGVAGLWLPARDHLRRVLLPLHTSQGLHLSGDEGGGSENIESRFSGNICPPFSEVCLRRGQGQSNSPRQATRMRFWN